MTNQEFVAVIGKRNRGWPWPERTWGLESLYGSDGWCHSCGIPFGEQSGDMVLQARGLTIAGAWIPNWRHDAICIEDSLASEVAQMFRVQLRPIRWPRGEPAGAMQVIPKPVGDTWFDEAELRERTVARHGEPGATCAGCGRWLWLPLPHGALPAARFDPAKPEYDLIASPEWFGSGMQAYRQVRMVRPLAELLSSASPRDFGLGRVAPAC